MIKSSENEHRCYQHMLTKLSTSAHEFNSKIAEVSTEAINTWSWIHQKIPSQMSTDAINTWSRKQKKKNAPESANQQRCYQEMVMKWSEKHQKYEYRCYPHLVMNSSRGHHHSTSSPASRGGSEPVWSFPWRIGIRGGSGKSGPISNAQGTANTSYIWWNNLDFHFSHNNCTYCTTSV